MEKFKVGDRVKFDKSKNKAFLFGETTDKGIVTGISATTNIHVKFSNGNEQYVFPESLELDKPTIEEIFDMPAGTKTITDLEENNIFFKSVDENHFHNKNTFIGKSDLTDDLKITDRHCGTRILKIEIPATYDIVYDAGEEVKEISAEEAFKQLEKLNGCKVKIIKEEKCKD